MTILRTVTKEIVELHDFFTEWFKGTVERQQLEPRFLSRLHEGFVFIPPDGQVITRELLKEIFDRGYGTNNYFKIQIRDVTICHEVGNLMMATYTEWQVGAIQSENTNARVVSILIEMTTPVKWLHIHETWLPESVRPADSFDF